LKEPYISNQIFTNTQINDSNPVHVPQQYSDDNFATISVIKDGKTCSEEK